MNAIPDQIKLLRAELSELENPLPNWDSDAGHQNGARRYGAIAKRISESAKRLEQLFKEHTFPNR